MDFFDVGEELFLRRPAAPARNRLAAAAFVSVAAALWSSPAPADPVPPPAAPDAAPAAPAATSTLPPPAAPAVTAPPIPTPSPPATRATTPTASPPAPSPPPPPEPSEGTGERKGGIHGVALVTLGSCVRVDTDIGGTGFCGEAGGGIDLHVAPRWHVDVEMSLGYMAHVASGDINLGAGESSGGGYLVLRPMLGYDFTPLFFMRAGAQMRSTYTFDKVAPGFQGAIDLGTRLCAHFEFGLRGIVGSDAFVTGGIGQDSTVRYTLAYGTSLLGRYLFP